MGMAAGQARLLSITSRMSDNELRAQIINNNKMRLAAESSQVSENYVTALNEAQLMFSNYDKDNNASYQQLTFNALTSYNPYNNQYALINSAGQVMLSEKDAINYTKHPNDLEGFLEEYGLKQSTTYFDELKAHVSDGTILDADGNPIPDGNVIYTYFGDDGIALNQNSGLTPEELEVIYFGYGAKELEGKEFKGKDLSEVTIDSLTGRDEIQPLGYYNVQNSEDMYNYLNKLNIYTDRKEKFLELVATAMAAELDDIIKNNFSTIAPGVTNLDSLLTTISNTNDTAKLKQFMEILMEIIGPPAPGTSSISPNARSYLKYDQNGQLANANAIDSLDSLYERLKDNKDYRLYAAWGIQRIRDNTDTITDGIANGDSLSDNIWTYDDNGQPYDFTNGGSQEIQGQTFVVKWDDYTNPNIPDDQLDLKVYTNNSPDNMQSVMKTVLTTLAKSLINIWDPDLSLWAEKTDTIKAAYHAYIDAAAELGNEIYGPGVYASEGASGHTDDNSKHYTILRNSPAMKELDDISALYNGLATNGSPGSFRTTTMDPADDAPHYGFYQIYMNIVLDNVMSTYGEPKVTWIDKSNPRDSYNENAEAKYDWYRNLYERIEQSGYYVVKDGLASSADWMQYAFESGIVTMEQYDKSSNWNPLIYSNCSDITSRTNDVAVAKAEAEYKTAMNKIENKDKRYDMELKNIDTEHNALQTEYDSIKTAIDKNIERTLKLYS